MDCIDLNQFGDKYKLSLDPAAKPRNKDPWLITMLCRHGEIYPFGGNLLAASTNTRGPVANQLAKLGRIHQDGDDGITVVFDVADFDAVAKVMKPKRRRKLSPWERSNLALASRPSRISTGAGAPYTRAKRRSAV
jgi:hypothetical protein